MSKWFVSMFILAFCLTIYGLGFADNVGPSGTCKASAKTDSYVECNYTITRGDGKPGKLDDYKFHVKTYWKAENEKTAYIDRSTFTSSGVSKNTQDILKDLELRGSADTTKSFKTDKCVGRKMYKLNCTTYYHHRINVDPSNNKITLIPTLYEPDSGINNSTPVYFSPTK